MKCNLSKGNMRYEIKEKWRIWQRHDIVIVHNDDGDLGNWLRERDRKKQTNFWSVIIFSSLPVTYDMIWIYIMFSLRPAFLSSRNWDMFKFRQRCRTSGEQIFKPWTRKPHTQVFDFDFSSLWRRFMGEREIRNWTLFALSGIKETCVLYWFAFFYLLATPFANCLEGPRSCLPNRRPSR